MIDIQRLHRSLRAPGSCEKPSKRIVGADFMIDVVIV